jgi:peptidoglycan/xylan/chitin deacetylase (PgdA/CDA1 family)
MKKNLFIILFLIFLLNIFFNYLIKFNFCLLPVGFIKNIEADQETIKINKILNITVLCYHNIKEIAENEFDVSVEIFDKQMKFIKENNIESLFASEIVEILNEKNLDFFKNKKYVAITFDDGNKGVYTYAKDILRKYNLKATLYIYPSIIYSAQKGTKKNYMIFNEIRELLNTGYFELGCHSYYHPYMTKENEKGLILNTIGAKDVLYKETGYVPLTFAYPFGLYDNKVIEYVKKAGFSGAFTVERKNIYEDTDPYKIPRYMITKNTSYKRYIDYFNKKKEKK